MSFDLYELHARDKAGMPPEWKAFRWQALPLESKTALYFLVTGMIAPLRSKGKNKGRPNWRMGDRSTQRAVVLPIMEHEEWVRAWEILTGKCAKCGGEGQTMASCNFVTAEKTYRPCSGCAGTGKAPQ